jgi:hypothetical protein
MAIKVKVRHDRQIICPLRFTRAVTGAAVIDAPEVDDRGFAMGARPGTWGSSPARGAMVGVTEGDTVRIKLLREDIDDTAPLFATSTDTNCAQVMAPAGGGPIPNDGILSIKGVRDYASRPVSIQVRLGSTSGPVLGEIEPHIFQLRRLRVIAHLVTINGTATARTAASLVSVFQTVNTIWRPLGIEFVYDPAQTRTETITGFSVAGQITTRGSASTPGHTGNVTQDHAELSRVLNLRPVANHINMYMVVNINEAVAFTWENTIARPVGYGMAIRDDAIDQTFAHELCHYLDNPRHAQDGDAPGNPGPAHQDMWARRRLMWTPFIYPATGIAHRDDVGYGGTTRGSLISVKDFPDGSVDRTDGETARARRRSLNPY